MPKPYQTQLRLKNGKTVRFPAVMGVLNVTPDSFSDGGRYLDPARAVEHALEMVEAGADIVDLGGESTRPGAREVPAEEEMRRVMPVLRALAKVLRVPLSVDTRKSTVARAALAEGAALVNDVSALTFDPEMAKTVAEEGGAVVLMHMRGTPRTMMRRARYRDVVTEVRAALSARVRLALAAGIPASRIILDPGLGFAKTAAQSLRLLVALPRLCALGYPVLVGASRKSFIRRIAGDGEMEVAFGTAAANVLALLGGASIIRVHEPGPAVALARMVSAAIAHEQDWQGCIATSA